jgi:hypothetical protein
VSSDGLGGEASASPPVALKIVCRSFRERCDARSRRSVPPTSPAPTNIADQANDAEATLSSSAGRAAGAPSSFMTRRRPSRRPHSDATARTSHGYSDASGPSRLIALRRFGGAFTKPSPDRVTAVTPAHSDGADNRAIRLSRSQEKTRDVSPAVGSHQRRWNRRDCDPPRRVARVRLLVT